MQSTLDEERKLSNRSNSTENVADDFQISYTVTAAAIQFFLSLVGLFMVIYLSIQLKKRAWDSPSKRFGHFFNVSLALTALCNVPILFNQYFSSGLLLHIVFVTSSSLSLSCFLYFTAVYVALSLQVVAPFLPERLKVYAHKTHCVQFLEITSHVLFLLVAISFSVFVYYNLHFLTFYTTIFAGTGIILIVLSYSVLILAFVFLMKFFKYQNNKKKGIKYMIIRLLFFLIIFITLVITFVLAVVNVDFSDFWSNVAFNNTDGTLIIQMVLVILQFVYYFIFSISVVSLNHPLDIWCCKWCCRRSPGRAPLLPVNDTEGQQTNPISVWDHRNVPSYTVTNLPYDMSDCRSDYEQLA